MAIVVLAEAGDGSAFPGETVEMRFPLGSQRNSRLLLSRWTGEHWELAYQLFSAREAEEFGPPFWAELDEVVGTIGAGLGGEGPEFAVIPEVAEPGWYQICTHERVEDRHRASDDCSNPLRVSS